jgi:hypothetical protein
LIGELGSSSPGLHTTVYDLDLSRKKYVPPDDSSPTNIGSTPTLNPASVFVIKLGKSEFRIRESKLSNCINVSYSRPSDKVNALLLCLCSPDSDAVCFTASLLGDDNLAGDSLLNIAITDTGDDWVELGEIS